MENCKQGRSVLLFYVENSLYMISVKDIVTIIPLPEQITNVPHSPEYICGICSIKGENFTLVDLNRLLKVHSSVEAPEVDCGVIIALECNVALRVTGIIGVEPLKDFFHLQGGIVVNRLIKNYYKPSETMWGYELLKGENEIAFELDVSQMEDFRQLE